jgi:hypothetical protein
LAGYLVGGFSLGLGGTTFAIGSYAVGFVLLAATAAAAGIFTQTTVRRATNAPAVAAD